MFKPNIKSSHKNKSIDRSTSYQIASFYKGKTSVVEQAILFFERKELGKIFFPNKARFLHKLGERITSLTILLTSQSSIDVTLLKCGYKEQSHTSCFHYDSL